MKKTFVLSLLLLTTFLAACAGTPAERRSYLQVKCPACGYQFQAPAE